MIIDNFQRQHSDILEILGNIRNVLNKGNISHNVDELIKNVNILAGKLKIHLNSEDRFLYSKITQSNDKDLKKLSKHYEDDMTQVTKEFSIYREKYKVKRNIVEDETEFKRYTLNIISVLEKRIKKEEEDFYPQLRGQLE